MTSTRGMILAGIIGVALGVYVGTTMQRSPTTRQIRLTSQNLWRRARGVVQNGVNTWME